MTAANILGTEYMVEFKKREQDELLQRYDGYCDKTSRKIVVVENSGEYEVGNFRDYQKKVLRHEVIHAFLFESGLHENWEHAGQGHDETTVDWIAVQFPKIMKVFEKLNCL